MDDLAWGDIEGHTINAGMLLGDEPCGECRESQCDADCGCMCHTPLATWDELGGPPAAQPPMSGFAPHPFILPQSHYDDLAEILGHAPEGYIAAKRIGADTNAR